MRARTTVACHKAMILGWITRWQYLEHHEPERWRVSNPPAGR
jgi:hypothetical protein